MSIESRSEQFLHDKNVNDINNNKKKYIYRALFQN